MDENNNLRKTESKPDQENTEQPLPENIDRDAANAPVSSNTSDKAISPGNTAQQKKPNKKRIAIIAGIAAAIVVVAAVAFSSICFHNEWKEPTCTDPKTCAECGKTEGEALGHQWKDATCTEPKTCSRCGATEGDAIGHKTEEWTVTTEPTCVEAGERTAKCTVCKETVTENIPTVDHTPSDWTIEKEPTVESDGSTKKGVRVKTCTVCGKELESESFEATPEELMAAYKEECSPFSYGELSRNPDSYKGNKAMVSGRVLQVVEGNGNRIAIRLATSGKYDDVMYVEYTMKSGQSRILEDDTITVYGALSGLYSYESTGAGIITLPAMKAMYIE